MVIPEDDRARVIHRVGREESYLDLGSGRVLPVPGTGAVAHLSADGLRALVRLVGVADNEPSLVWLERAEEGWLAKSAVFGRPSTWSCLQDRRAVVLLDEGTFTADFGEEHLTARTAETSVGACVWRGDLQVQIRAQDRGQGPRTYVTAQDGQELRWSHEADGLGRLTAPSDGSLYCLSTETRVVCLDRQGERLLDQPAQDVLPIGDRTVALLGSDGDLSWRRLR